MAEREVAQNALCFAAPPGLVKSRQIIDAHRRSSKQIPEEPEKRVRVRPPEADLAQALAGRSVLDRMWDPAPRTGADGVLWLEFSGFGRFKFATLRLIPPGS